MILTDLGIYTLDERTFEPLKFGVKVTHDDVHRWLAERLISYTCPNGKTIVIPFSAIRNFTYA